MVAPPQQPNGALTKIQLLVDGGASVILAGVGDATLSGLSPFTVYSIVAEACTSGGCRQSPAVAVTTASDIPAGVFSPSALAVSPSVLRISWQEPEFANGRLTAYNLHRTPGGGMLGDVTTQRLAADVFSFDDAVTPFSQYEYVLEVVNTEGSASSQPLKVTSGEAPAQDVAKPVVQVIDGTTAGVTWTPPATPNGVLVAYRLQVWPYFIMYITPKPSRAMNDSPASSNANASCAKCNLPASCQSMPCSWNFHVYVVRLPVVCQFLPLTHAWIIS